MDSKGVALIAAERTRHVEVEGFHKHHDAAYIDNELTKAAVCYASVPVVRAEGKLIHLGRQIATSEARLVGPDGKLYAHGTTTCFVFDQTP